MARVPAEGDSRVELGDGDDATALQPSRNDAGAAPPLGSERIFAATEVSADPLLGAQVGEYIVRRRIGDGGMGVVYEAEQPLIHRRVAIKLLRPHLTNDQFLLSEARSASAIRHRGIVDVFGFGELPGIGRYMVMEFLDGEGLDAIILEKAPLPLQVCLQILDEACAALDAAHTAGIIHRDLKPSNLFWLKETSGTRYLKILDFGVALKTTPGAEGSPVAGSPSHMPPEQAKGALATARSDLFALGVVAYQMLTGRMPFETTTLAAVHARADLRVTPPSYLVSLPTEVDELVLDLLNPDPSQRPGSAEVVRRRVKRLLQRFEEEKTAQATVERPALSRELLTAAERPKPAAAEPDAAPTVRGRAMKVDYLEPTAAGATRPDLEPPGKFPWGQLWSHPLVWIGVGAATAAVTLTVMMGADKEEPSPVDTPAPVSKVEAAPIPRKNVAAPEETTKQPLGALTLLTTPEATVYRGGELIGKTPLIKQSFPAGTSLLLLKGTNGDKRVLSVKIEEGRTTQLKFRLADLPKK